MSIWPAHIGYVAWVCHCGGARRPILHSFRLPDQRCALQQPRCASRGSGQRGTFGPVLNLRYHLPAQEQERLQLFSLEGWIGWSGETAYTARLHIPTQTLWQGNTALQVPITDAQIEAIEQKRNGNPVHLIIFLTGQAVVPLVPAAPATVRPSAATVPALPSDQPWMSLVPIYTSNAATLTIERERWLQILEQLGAGKRRLVELPEPRLPRDDPRWAECLRLLEAATQLYRNEAYEHALVNCRQIAEGIPQVLCAAWGLPQQQCGQALANWMIETERRLLAAWLEDRHTAGMLRTLVTGLAVVGAHTPLQHR